MLLKCKISTFFQIKKFPLDLPYINLITAILCKFENNIWRFQPVYTVIYRVKIFKFWIFAINI